MNLIDIGTRKIGSGSPCFVIAEAGVNHNGDIDIARQLIEVAAAAGADAVKFQTFRAESLVTADAPKADYQRQHTKSDESQMEMLRQLELSPEEHRELMACAHNRGIAFLSTPFDEECADFLDGLGVPLFKLPSGEITNLSFLDHVARKRKPIILSTGMSTLGEVELAVKTIMQIGNKNLVLLHCISNYPADPAEVNLRAMHTMAVAFGLPLGFSDHTLGMEVALAAVALGACVIEKHFTLDRSLPGPDHRASSEPDELMALVRGIRKVESSLGNGAKAPSTSETKTAAVARKSLIAVRDIEPGEVLTEDSLGMRRPGTGLPANVRPILIGRHARVRIHAGTLIGLEMIS